MVDRQRTYRTLYRVVARNPPTVEDFLSMAALGFPPPVDDPAKAELWSGISAYNTEAQARRNAVAFPGHGVYIAELRIPEAGPIRYRRTLRSTGHHTVWGDPAAVLRCVVAVVQV